MNKGLQFVIDHIFQGIFSPGKVKKKEGMGFVAIKA